MRRLGPALVAMGCWATGLAAQEADPEASGPELDFLEYLGAWVEEDDEWLAIEEWQKGNAADPDEDRQAPEREKEDRDESE